MRCAGAAVASGRSARGHQWPVRSGRISSGRSTSCRTCWTPAGASGVRRRGSDSPARGSAAVVDTSLPGLRVARELDRHRGRARQARDDRLRQRHRADLKRHPQWAEDNERRMALHRAGQAACRMASWRASTAAAGRVPERAPCSARSPKRATSSKLGAPTTTAHQNTHLSM